MAVICDTGAIFAIHDADDRDMPGALAMNQIPVEQAQGRLAAIIAALPVGDELVLTQADKPVAIVRAIASAPQKKRRFGTLKGSILSIAPDFDTIPEGFEDYLP
jgi:antitoxin (DNA-binding transcriptional repressor) of toxin-antitoxin stability system